MFREVTMVELKEVLRLWGKGLPKRRIAAQLGLDPKTVRESELHGTGSSGPELSAIQGNDNWPQ